MNNLWVLVWQDKDGISFIEPLDSNDGHEDQGMLVYRSFEAATAAAKHQQEEYSNDEETKAVAMELSKALSLIAS